MEVNGVLRLSRAPQGAGALTRRDGHLEDPLAAVRDAVLPQGLPVALQALLRRRNVGRPVQERDLGMALADEMFRCKKAAPFIICHHAGKTASPEPASQQHERNTVVLQEPEVGNALLARADDYPVDLLADRGKNRPPLPIVVLIRVLNEQVEVALPQARLDVTQQNGKQRVGNVGNDHRDGLAPPRTQRRRQGIRNVAQTARFLLNEAAGALRDVVLALERPRHGVDGIAGHVGQVAERHGGALRVLPVAHSWLPDLPILYR